MIKSKLVSSVYGKLRVIENYQGIKRLYVKKTNVKTWVISDSERLTLDSMIMINGEYHFSTLKELYTALNVIN